MLEEFRGLDALYLGAVGDPRVPPGVLERDLLLRIRFELDQYVNLRPVRPYPGVALPLAGVDPTDVDMVFVRENSEGLYAGAGGFHRQGTRRGGRRSRRASTPAAASTGACGSRSSWRRRPGGAGTSRSSTRRTS